MDTTHTPGTPATPDRRRARRFSPAALAVAAALTAGGLYGVAQAADTAPAATAATTSAAKPTTPQGDKTDALLKYSQAGRDAFDNIRMARFDLFNGHTDAAMKEMKAAQMSLITAKAEAPTFDIRTRTQMMGKVVGTDHDTITADAVPVGGDLILADDFQVSERHQPTLAKARAHLAKGDKKAAVEVLKQGDIDVSYNRQWLPLARAEQQLDQAITLSTSKHYYDANLALKAIEDGVQVDTVSFDVPPSAS